MPEYIDKEKLKRDLIDNRCFYPVIVKKAIEDAPTEDVVKVVRCKDCVFCKYNTSSLRYKCDRRGYFTEEVEPSDFCSKGERKE